MNFRPSYPSYTLLCQELMRETTKQTRHNVTHTETPTKPKLETAIGHMTVTRNVSGRMQHANDTVIQLQCNYNNNSQHEHGLPAPNLVYKYNTLRQKMLSYDG
eukprot:6461855-Amphidinium_carterae.3